jgi:nucleoside-diphosphate-sugar epimerase
VGFYVVTGGAGFIGSHIAAALVERGERVIVLDDFSTGKPDNLESLDGSVDVRRVNLATDPIAEHLADVDTVFHQAAIPSVPQSVKDPVTSHQANVNGTLNLLVACRDRGVRRVVYASSCSVFGDSPELPKREDMAAVPLSPYGAQKYFGEVYAQVFWRAYGLETVALRYFNVFGPRQDVSSPYSGVLAKFIPAVLTGRRPVIYGDGFQSRDFTFVSNVVDANLKASEVDGVAGEVFNIACGDRITVNQVLDEINSLTQSQIAPIYETARPGDILHSQADPAKAMQLLGWSPVTGFRDGLRKTIDWYRDNS